MACNHGAPCDPPGSNLWGECYSQGTTNCTVDGTAQCQGVSFAPVGAPCSILDPGLHGSQTCDGAGRCNCYCDANYDTHCGVCCTRRTDLCV